MTITRENLITDRESVHTALLEEPGLRAAISDYHNIAERLRELEAANNLIERLEQRIAYLCGELFKADKRLIG